MDVCTTVRRKTQGASLSCSVRCASSPISPPATCPATLLRRWSNGDPLAPSRAKHAERRFAHLRSLEFCFPETDKICCVQ